MLRSINFFVGLAAVSALVGCGESEQPPQEKPVVEFLIKQLPADGGVVKLTVGGVESMDGKVKVGDIVQLTATPQNGYVFKEWSFSDEFSLDDGQSSKAKKIDIDTDRHGLIIEVTANFEKILEVNGGTWINGVVWANCNVDEPGKFTKRPEDPGMLYQWNKRIGFSSTDPIICSDGSRIYENWKDRWWPMNADRVDENGKVVDIFERAEEPCPAGWRMPTTTEAYSLCKWPYFGSGNTNFFPEPEHVTYEKIAATDSSMAGLKITCNRSGNSIFLPAVGYRCGMDHEYAKYELVEQNVAGYYRSNENDRGFSFNTKEIGADRQWIPLTAIGASSVRCVADLK